MQSQMKSSTNSWSQSVSVNPISYCKCIILSKNLASTIGIVLDAFAELSYNYREAFGNAFLPLLFFFFFFSVIKKTETNEPNCHWPGELDPSLYWQTLQGCKDLLSFWQLARECIGLVLRLSWKGSFWEMILSWDFWHVI